RTGHRTRRRRTPPPGPAGPAPGPAPDPGRRKRASPPAEPKVTGEVEARVIALACTKPPSGYERWSLRLLEKHVVLTDGIPPLDHSTIGRGLKKGGVALI